MQKGWCGVRVSEAVLSLCDAVLHFYSVIETVAMTLSFCAAGFLSVLCKFLQNNGL